MESVGTRCTTFEAFRYLYRQYRTGTNYFLTELGSDVEPEPPSWLAGAGPKLKGSTTLELGTRQHGRVNVTLFSGHKGVGYCNITKVVVVSPFRHKDIIIFLIFSCPEISIMFLRCRCSEAKKMSRARFCFIIWSLMTSVNEHDLFTLVSWRL